MTDCKVSAKISFSKSCGRMTGVNVYIFLLANLNCKRKFGIFGNFGTAAALKTSGQKSGCWESGRAGGSERNFQISLSSSVSGSVAGGKGESSSFIVFKKGS